MLNRSTNLLVLLMTGVALIVLATNIESAWRHTSPSEQGWVAKPDGEPSPKYTADQHIVALHKANLAEDYSSAHEINESLERDYMPSGDIHVRFTIHEILEALTYTGAVLLFPIIPISLNYIRHGSFRFWNRGT